MPEHNELAPITPSTPATPYAPNHRPQSVRDLAASEVDTFSYLRSNWDIVVKHRSLILAVTAVLTIAVAIYSFKVKPVYMATARIEVEAEQPLINKLDDLFRGSERSDMTFLSTQVSVLESDNLAWQAIQQLELARLPEFGVASRQPRGVVGTTMGAEHTALLTTFAEKRHVEQLKDTRMLEVSFESIDPTVAARVANALVDDYIEYNFRTKYDATRQATGWMEQQLDELKLKVEKSQQAMVDYEREHNIVDLGDKQSVSEARLEDLNKSVTLAQADRLQKESQYQMVKGNETLAGFLEGKETLLSHLEEREADLQDQYTQTLGQYGPNFPRVVRLRDEVGELDAAVKKERRRVVDSIYSDYMASVEREKLLSQAVAEQKDEVGQYNQLQIEHNLLKRDFEVNQQLYESLLQHLKDANVSAGLRATNIHKVDEAVPPTFPVRPKKGRNIAFGLIAGLVLGIAFALAREALDNSIKSAQEVEMLISAPALAIIPASSSRSSSYAYAYSSEAKQRAAKQGRNGAVELSVLTEPGSPISESFRTLRTSILLSTAEHPPQVLLVTSSQPNEGKTSTSLNLAFTLAQKGDRVLIVDGDLRRPGVARALKIPNEKGLSGVLTGAYELKDATIRLDEMENLWVLPSGPHPPNPAELLCSMKMERLIKELRQQFSHVVVDSPPVLLITDATIVSSMVDGVVMVVESEGTTRAALARACRTIQHSGGRILGAVLNKVDARRDGYYGHYYYPGYYGYYSEHYKDYYKAKDGGADGKGANGKAANGKAASA